MPKVEFKYDIEKDSSNILTALTKPPTYDVKNTERWKRGLDKELIEKVDSIDKIEEKKKAIDIYLKEKFFPENENRIKEKIKSFQKEWDEINNEFFKRLGKIFNITIPEILYIAYLTSANRCPFNTEENSFMVKFKNESIINTAAHELMHIEFIHTYGLYCKNSGLSEKNFSNLWESLTVLLNEEMSDILPHPDYGYEVHQELRSKISAIWKENKSFKPLLDKLIKLLNNPTK